MEYAIAVCTVVIVFFVVVLCGRNNPWRRWFIVGVTTDKKNHWLFLPSLSFTRVPHLPYMMDTEGSGPLLVRYLPLYPLVYIFFISIRMYLKQMKNLNVFILFGLFCTWSCCWYLLPLHLFGPSREDMLVIRDIVVNHKLTLIGSKQIYPVYFMVQYFIIFLQYRLL